MNKCIYCNSEDLTVSDIIPCALTGAKLTKRFVCKEHNAFTNDNFEKIAIARWDFFRSTVGLKERKGADIKYDVEFRADGVVVPNMTISGRASIYEDKKRLFHGEQNGRKVLIGNVDKLAQKKGVKEEDIKALDMKDAVVRVPINLMQLLASEEMLRTIAKVAYEWHCYVNSIDGFLSEKYHEIVDCILLEKSAEEIVDICADGLAYGALSTQCPPGSHGLYEYCDLDGYKYIVFFFWGVVMYRIRICREVTPNLEPHNMYNLEIFGVDGAHRSTVFAAIGPSHITTLPAKEAVQKYGKFFASKLYSLLTTIVLSLERVKALIDELKNALTKYKAEPHDFARLVDYESSSRFFALRILFLLSEHQSEYDFQKAFNENMNKLNDGKDTIAISPDEKKTFLLQLNALHENGTLASTIEKSIAFFDKVVEQENMLAEAESE